MLYIMHIHTDFTYTAVQSFVVLQEWQFCVRDPLVQPHHVGLHRPQESLTKTGDRGRYRMQITCPLYDSVGVSANGVCAPK